MGTQEILKCFWWWYFGFKRPQIVSLSTQNLFEELYILQNACPNLVKTHSATCGRYPWSPCSLINYQCTWWPYFVSKWDLQLFQKYSYSLDRKTNVYLFIMSLIKSPFTHIHFFTAKVFSSFVSEKWLIIVRQCPIFWRVKVHYLVP